jgi:uncharacterized membrane protein
MKRYFITGLLIWVPLGLTAWVLKFLIGTMDQSLLLLPDSLQPDRPETGFVLGRSAMAYPGS